MKRVGTEDREKVVRMGRAVRLARLARNVAQRELARRLNVKPPVLQRWENGRSVLPAYRLVEIARILDVSIPLLVSNEQKWIPERESACNRAVAQ